MGNTYSDTNHFHQEVNLSQFKVIESIGQGAFCKVYKAQHVQQKELYALKVINKEKCINMKAAYNIVRERRILESLDHPLICNMRFAFQDTSSMYMVLDLKMAGDLRFHITSSQYGENDILFWISELICAIQYLHSQRIVHRDIKPENILLDQEGHVHLTDFNVASKITLNKHLTSLSGTAAYFAPEMFKGFGYNEDVDWWCLGITFYECVYKKRPWSHCNNIKELKQQVTNQPILYPSSTVSFNCTLALKSFLEKDPKKRLGHGISGWHRIVSHPFFSSIDWYSMDNKRSLPTYRPEKNQEDLTSEIKLSEQGGWLYRRRASDGRKDRRMSQDLKLLENQYKPFDYTVFDEYKGFSNETLMTVGPPPPWVKPAFPDADNGSILPVQRIFLEKIIGIDDHKLCSWDINSYS